MGQTITEKILARAAGRDTVEPGEFVNARFDVIFAGDLGSGIHETMARIGVDRVCDPERVFITMDHHVPSSSIDSATSAQAARQFAENYGIKHFYEMGRGGIMHAIFMEEGYMLPGDVIAGGDSHSVTAGAIGAFATGLGVVDMGCLMATGEMWLRVPETIRIEFEGRRDPAVTGKDLMLYTIGQIGTDGALYQTMEFGGPVVAGLSMDERLTMANMAVEAGAKNGIFEPDDVTRRFLEGRAKRPFTEYHSDPDIQYCDVIRFDCSRIEPQVALPHSPGNVKPAREVKDVKVNQVVIGSCTNGRISDLRQAASVLRGKRVHPDVRVVVIPATQQTWLQADKEGLLGVFIESGCLVCPPTCGPCFGGHMGVIAEGEVAISTTNRNFRGRMGHPNSYVYLASPATAAASAIKGQIVDPRDL